MPSLAHTALALFVACFVFGDARAFSISPPNSRCRVVGTILTAKKKGKRRGGGGQGFGKAEPDDVADDAVVVGGSVSVQETSEQPTATSLTSPFLQSIEGGSTMIPAQETVTNDSSASAEDRAKTLLRQKYGMKTLEEERLNQEQQAQLRAQREKFAQLQARAEEEDFDILALLPPQVLQGIFTLLQAGLAVVGTTFLLSGLAITAEAWSKATQNPLPDDIDNFIATIVEPNFTTQLLVLLGFSITLGVLAAAQLGSKSAQYREE